MVTGSYRGKGQRDEPCLGVFQNARLNPTDFVSYPSLTLEKKKKRSLVNFNLYYGFFRASKLVIHHSSWTQCHQGLLKVEAGCQKRKCWVASLSHRDVSAVCVRKLEKKERTNSKLSINQSFLIADILNQCTIFFLLFLIITTNSVYCKIIMGWL